jgi:hypothetical protein
MKIPDATAKAERAASLMTLQALGQLLNRAIKRPRAAAALSAVADQVAKASNKPMSMQEIDAEVKAVRKRRRQRAHRP